MMTELRAKVVSSDTAAALVKPGDWVDYGAGLGQPDLFDHALARRKNQLHDVRIRSRIVSSPTPGNIVTTPRTDVMYVVTEYGIMNLKGKSVAERAKALISLAHPDFREQLEREAREHALVPRTFW